MKIEIVFTKGDEVPPTAQETRLDVSYEQMRVIICTMAGLTLFPEEQAEIRSFYRSIIGQWVPPADCQERT